MTGVRCMMDSWLVILPGPTGCRNIEIRIKGQVSNQAVATLYDVQGRVILVKTLEEGNLNVVHTPNIKTAIYMLSVNDKGKLQRFKIPVNE